MVMEVVHEDMGDGNMQCTNHPYKNSAPGGICAFCLQEKLGKLVSSSFPIAVFPSSSSSPSPSFRSDFDTSSAASATGAAAAAAARHLPPSSSQNGGGNNEICYYTRRSSRLPFVLTHRKKKKNCINNGVSLANGSSENTSSSSNSIVFKRSKSTVTPRRRGMHFLDESFDSPYKKGFWSFLKHKKSEKSLKDLSFTPATPNSSTVGGSSSVSGVAGPARSRDKKREDHFDENESPDDVGLDRKVSRSRSVGCGSRSFSGDFFERISTGFGDCTLRRVESQREGKSKVQSSIQRNGGGGGQQDCIKERVRCGGIFSGFMITSSSSSSSSMVSEDNNNINGKSISVNNNNNDSSSAVTMRNLSHGRSKSWGWALASPMRVFSKPSSNSAGKRGAAKHVTPNLAAIPSLLAVSS